MWREKSETYITTCNRKYQLICNQHNRESYIERLSKGESFYFDNSGDIGYLTFSIEEAVKIRDYLNEMIEVAEQSGYFDKGNHKEMTMTEIEAALGHKIKIVG